MQRLKTAVCVSTSVKFKEGRCVSDPVRLCENGPEGLSNKHTQSLNGLLKKGQEKPRSIYITEEKECL